MLFEWRTYRFAPGRATAYLELFRREGLPLVTRHLPLLGYWQTESGRLNVLHHLWVYRDLDDRTACRALLAGDAEWTAGFGPRAFPMIEQQETLMLAAQASSAALEASVGQAREPVPAADGGAVLSDGWATFEQAEAPAAFVSPGPTAVWRVLSARDPAAS